MASISQLPLFGLASLLGIGFAINGRDHRHVQMSQKSNMSSREIDTEINDVLAPNSTGPLMQSSQNQASLQSTLPPPAWIERGRIPGLDGLRAIAVIMVMMAHACQTTGFPQLDILTAIARHGGLGVEIFFVISGFLITNLLLREIRRTQRVDLQAFYVRRSLRIFPAYLCLLGTVFVVSQLGFATISWRDWLAATTYTLNFVHRPAWEVGHAWSLSIEEHFYLLWPLLLLLLGTVRSGRIAIGCLVFCFSARWIVLFAFPQWSQMAELWTFTRLDTIAAGCLLALMAGNEAWRDRLNSLCAFRGAVPVYLALLILAVGLCDLSGKLSVGVGYSVNAVLIALLLWSILLRSDSRLGQFLEQDWLVAIGIRSYSIYLWQQLFLHPYRHDLLSSFPQNIVLAFGAACLSYNLIELPALKLKSRFAAANTVAAQ